MTVETVRPAAPLPLVQARRARPVLWFAALGVGFFLFCAYLMIRWVTGPDFTRLDPGPTPVPGYMRVAGWMFTLGGGAVYVVTMVVFVVRPWRRERRLTFDGLVVLAVHTIVWADALQNIIQPSIVYNRALPNLGNWYGAFPGWISPHPEKLAVPIAWNWPVYSYTFLLPAVAGCALMKRVARRWPRLGNPGRVLIVFGVFVVLDVVLEGFLWIRAGVYAYPGSIEWLTLWSGRYYQFPIYQGILWPGVWTAFTCLRYFRDDHGHSIVERGIDRVAAGPRAKTVLRFFAIVAAANIVYVTYQLSLGAFAAYQTGWPDDITKRSYLVNELCGAGTDQACPGARMPIARRDSVHLDPTGNVVVPPGLRLPAAVPLVRK